MFESLSPTLILSGVAFLTSALSGVVGMGGGTLLLATMAHFFAPAVLIPIHGIVQLGSNVSRASIGVKDIRWSFVLPFLVGACLGAFLGSRFVLSIPESIMSILLATFILVMTWLPPLKNPIQIPGKFFLTGIFISFISLFLGATGPVQAPFFLNENLTKHELIATKAACQSLIHLLKIIVFGFLGFTFSQYYDLLFFLLISVTLGSLVGKWFLERLPEEHFLLIFKIATTILVIPLILKGFRSFL